MTEDMISNLVMKIKNNYKFEIGNNKEINFEPPFQVIDMIPFLEKKLEINFPEDMSTSEFNQTLIEYCNFNKIGQQTTLTPELSKEDIKTRNLPNQTSGLVITQIDNNSPLVNSIEVNSIILEAQKKKIKSFDDLNQAVKKVLESNQKTILLVIYNSQNQRRYIGIKLD